MKSINIVVLLFAVAIVSSVSGQVSYLANDNGAPPGSYLGWDWAQDLDFKTNDILRMQLMQTQTNTINGFPGIAQDGYLGLSTELNFFGGVGPFSMLHLNGTTSTGAIQLGYRPWMKTGITFTENTDMMYVGRKSSGSGEGTEDQTDAVISWSDDEASPPFSGPDNMLFLFTKGNAGGISNPDGDLTGTGINGREVMRMTASGNVGVGPRFDNDNQPKSTLHQHQENFSESWLQVTNQAMTSPGNQTEPTAINATNGLRIGINGDENQQINGNALIYNQEARHLLFSTAHSTDATDVGNGNTLERMRISSISAPTNLATGGYGVYNPASLPSNFTRVAISRDPNNPVTRPMSLLHLGHNIGTAGAPTSTHGWRRWMDLGTFTTNETDNLYVGLKAEGDNAYDAIINWGDDQDTTAQDNLRFIFTSTPGGSGDAESQSFHGKEVGRFAPTGEFGIGNFYTTGLNEQPTEKLDVDGTARLRQMPANAPNVLITGVEQDENPVNGDYVLNYLEFTGNSGDLLAGDGTWVDGSGTLCEWNIVGGGNDLATGYPGACVPGNVGIGDLPPGNAKLFVQDELDTPNSMGVQVNTTAVAPFTFGLSSTIESTIETATHIFGVHGNAINGKAPIGGMFEATADAEFLSQAAVGVFGHANAIGPVGNMHNSIGVYGLGESSVLCDRPIGVYGQAVNNTGCSTPIAGYFAGIVVDTQQPITLSDETIKTDVNVIENASELLQQIVPNSYYYIQNENATSAYSSELNYGFMAQQVQEVLPHIVQSVPSPIHLNQEGDIVSSDEELLGIQYGEFIPLLVAGFQEQQARIQTQDDEIAGLQESLTNQNELMMQMMEQMEMLQQQINGCCNGDAVPRNFGPSDETAPSANPFGQNELYQNVPNPFRGQTTIRYTLEQGGRAMLNIHDSNGREIAQLENAEQVAGTYSYEWDATGLPAGTYHYSLVVDGELLVKRAIKLQD